MLLALNKKVRLGAVSAGACVHTCICMCLHAGISGGGGDRKKNEGPQNEVEKTSMRTKKIENEKGDEKKPGWVRGGERRW